MSIQTPFADPLSQQPEARRPAYATGILLDAQDFTAEQTYHRARLARALAFLAGGGTLAGLRVRHVPGSGSQAEEIQVDAGLAADRLGRLVEILRPACLRLARWFDALPADERTLSSYDNLSRFASQRLLDAATPLPARALVADVFVRFAACEVGLTPSFAQGPYDALNAVATASLRDAYELRLVARQSLALDNRGLPQPPGAPAVAGADPVARRNAMLDAVIVDGYGGIGRPGGSGELGAVPGLPSGLDGSAVFLARVFIPVDNATPPARTADAPLVDNWARRILPPVALLGQWAGL